MNVDLYVDNRSECVSKVYIFINLSLVINTKLDRKYTLIK
jgi:hypothetical protein